MFQVPVYSSKLSKVHFTSMYSKMYQNFVLSVRRILFCELRSLNHFSHTGSGNVIQVRSCRSGPVTGQSGQVTGQVRSGEQRAPHPLPPAITRQLWEGHTGPQLPVRPGHRSDQVGGTARATPAPSGHRRTAPGRSYRSAAAGQVRPQVRSGQRNSYDGILPRAQVHPVQSVNLATAVKLQPCSDLLSLSCQHLWQ